MKAVTAVCNIGDLYYLYSMHITQYYAATIEERGKIIALAELLGCEYRAVEDIIAVQVDDDETLARLKRSECLPWVVEAGVHIPT